MTLADRIVVLHAGRIEQVGTPLELYNHPVNQFVAGFIGSPRMNFIPGTAEKGGLFRLADGTSNLLVNETMGMTGPMTLGIRPEHLMLAGQETPDFWLAIEIIEKLGSDSYLYGRLPDGTPLTVRSPLENPPSGTNGWASGSIAAACTFSTRPGSQSAMTCAFPNNRSPGR